MKKLLIATTALFMTFFVTTASADMSVYGSLNYMMSNDDNASGKSVLKAQNNGSKIGVDFSETLGEGETGITGFGKLEVGIDADDSGSDTFDSRLAYAGVDLGVAGAVSGGRQENPGAGVSKTNIFNVYGGNSVFKYADRTSNTVKYSNSIGPVSVDAMAMIDGATGKDGLDVTDISASMDVGPVAVAGGLIDDKVNNVKYQIASAGVDVAGISLAGTYSLKDTTTTDLTGMEYSASKVIGDSTLMVSLQDKEGTASYMTYGVSHNFSNSLTGYAEYQSTDNDTGVDTTQMAMGMKFSF